MNFKELLELLLEPINILNCFPTIAISSTVAFASNRLGQVVYVYTVINLLHAACRSSVIYTAGMLQEGSFCVRFHASPSLCCSSRQKHEKTGTLVLSHSQHDDGSSHGAQQFDRTDNHLYPGEPPVK
jgi:hypothetical protein